jgi:hypothetical protein
MLLEKPGSLAFLSFRLGTVPFDSYIKSLFRSALSQFETHTGNYQDLLIFGFLI